MRRRFFGIFRSPGEDEPKAESVDENRAVFLCDNPEQNGREASLVGLVLGAFWAILAWHLLGRGMIGWALALPLGFILLQVVTFAFALVLDQFLSGVFGLRAEEVRHIHSWVHLVTVAVTVVAADLIRPMGIACVVFAVAWLLAPQRNEAERQAAPRRTSGWVILLIIVHVNCAASLFYLPFWFRPVPTIVGLVIVLFVTHAAFLLGTLIPNSRLFGRVVRRYWPRERSVWLTIDDGVDPSTTPQILDLLRERGAKATFFVIGKRAENHPDIIERMAAEGHQIANHTRTHPKASWWIAFPGRVGREIGDSKALFRSPVGMSNVFVHSYLQQRGIPLIGWSARGLDGMATPRQEVVRTISEGISPGAILLMHDGYDPAERGYAPVDIVRDVLDELDSNGYACVIPETEQLLS